MKKIIVFFLLAFVSANCSNSMSGKANKDTNEKLLSVQEYKDAVYASWLGQIIGNTYGLCYEFHFIEEPGPDTFPYGYTWTLDLLKKYNGAFSDDDTDIEYMYLTQMEKNGIEPTYYHLAEAWKTHVKTKVWCANRAALTLMHAGNYPPVTGSKKYNTQWMQIDPQLVNEIWAVTAPGMLDYAVAKSKFAARITSDSFGIEPTLHYAAMYSAAFFEKDIIKLIDIGTSHLPEDCKFAKIVEHVKQLYVDYPDDWKAARKIVKENYLVYKDYNKYAWPPIDANLNGAYGIMALLYGQGDFQKTLDYCCAFGMDADNQAATTCGLLGIINGLHAIPKNLMFPLKDANWEKPFNDIYKMVTREGLEDASIVDMANRIAAQGENIILANGGEIIEKDGTIYYKINSNADYIAPFELNPLPDFYTEVDKTFSYPVYTGGNSATVKLSTEGILPPGIELKNEKIVGIATQKGTYSFNIVANKETQEKVIIANIRVHSKNLAHSASEIIFNPNAIDKNLEIIRDDKTDISYYSVKPGESREHDYYGYLWNNPQIISSLSYNNGLPQEYCGWFTSLNVEYLEDNKWKRIKNANIYPKINLENNQWLKAHFLDYEISFSTIETKGIRIIGLAGGVQKDANNAHLGLQYYTSISELRVYSE